MLVMSAVTAAVATLTSFLNNLDISLNYWRLCGRITYWSLAITHNRLNPRDISRRCDMIDRSI